MHLAEREEPPRQLFDSYIEICEAIRADSGREPEFNLPTDLRGEIVYELSADGRARWPLLGGMGGKAGKAVLVLTDRPAQAREMRIESTTPAEDEWVDLNYPTESGLAKQLEDEGFQIRWVRDDDIAKRLRAGWEPVVVEWAGGADSAKRDLVYNKGS